MKAILTNKINGVSVEVHSTTDHPDSSHGQPVWVDDEGQAYSQCNLPSPFYEIKIIEEEWQNEKESAHVSPSYEKPKD